MNAPLFLFGTLRDPDLYEIVAGAPCEAREAQLPDTQVRWVKGESYPVLTPHEGTTASGLVVFPDETARARIDFYETGFGYGVETGEVITSEGPVKANMYVPNTPPPLGANWDLEDWQSLHGPLSRLAAKEYMRLMRTHTPVAAARAFPTIQSRAASRLRARHAPSPEPMAPPMAQRAITPERTEQPYTDFFAVREDWLAFPKFDGSDGPVVKRATFAGGDAVTVLPYDPATGNVMVIRQFRHGAFVRGDSNPWTLEPAAGRIDPHEEPEDAAKRELVEETDVTADTLHFIGCYYPSPGAYSEYLYSFIATADLSGFDGTVGGLSSEAEDIMRHVLPLEEALAMIPTGAINTGPLILSLHWLQLHKDTLA